VAELASVLKSSSSDEEILFALRQGAGIAQAVASTITDWSFSGAVSGQYRADLSVNDAVLGAFSGFGCGVLSEESGATGVVPTSPSELGEGLVIVVDPIDGSTNASRGIPWYATALCAVDQHGPRVAVVAQLCAPHVEYVAIRGKGAWRNGRALAARSERPMAESVIGVSGPPPAQRPWWQFRALGSAALDLCLVAEGALDGYLDCDTHGVWDYLASMLICQESGVLMADAFGRDLCHFSHSDRRTPVAVRGKENLQALCDLRTASS
jgi:fructose-1,6-bisphosphatase/inositol monophosphatase family enzyme